MIGSEIYSVLIDDQGVAEPRLEIDLLRLRGPDRLAGRTPSGPLSKGVMDRVCRQGDGLFPNRPTSSFPAAAPIAPRCANMSRRRSMAPARGSTPSPNCCFACARSTPARSSPISTRRCRRRAAALERASTPAIFRISSASSWLRRPRRPNPKSKPRPRRSLRLRPQFPARRAAAPSRRSPPNRRSRLRRSRFARLEKPKPRLLRRR